MKMSKKRRPQVGDLAQAMFAELDARAVGDVSWDGKEIRLDIFGALTPWLPAENYTFTPRPGFVSEWSR